MLKRILSLILILSFVTLNTATVSAQNNQSNFQMTYLIYDTDGQLIESGIVPTGILRYTWDGVTLLNGQTAKFVPSHNSNGFYCIKNTKFTFGFYYKLALQYATLRLRIFRGSEYTTFTNTYHTSVDGHEFELTMLEDGYLFAEIMNLSSDPVTLSRIRIEF